jgi:drug/metabolite transporter (DMT)-like permease
MESFVFVAVLLAALCHAGWNALVKIGLDPLSSATLMSIGGVVIAAIALPFFALPAAACLPWLAASSVIHLFYFGGLVESYRTGDLSQVYPIARGAAPLMTAIATTAFLGERLSVLGWIGIFALVCGVVLLSVRGSRDLATLDRRAVGFALFTAVTICTYSVVDGIGARVSREPVAYSLWLFVGIAVALVPYAVVRLGFGVFHDVARFWSRGLIGGGLQIVSYGTALWAMTVAPIAVVAALRETSVLFGAVIAVVVLKEQMRATRIAAAVLILGGLVLIRLQ